MSFIDAEPFEHFSVLTKKFCRLASWRLPTRVQEFVRNMSSALDRVYIFGGELQRVVFGASVLRKKGMHDGGRCLMRDGARFFGISVRRS